MFGKNSLNNLEVILNVCHIMFNKFVFPEIIYLIEHLEETFHYCSWLKIFKCLILFTISIKRLVRCLYSAYKSIKYYYINVLQNIMHLVFSNKKLVFSQKCPIKAKVKNV